MTLVFLAGAVVFFIRHIIVPDIRYNSSLADYLLMIIDKSVDLICSGYKPDVLSKVWLSLITGIANIEVELEEPLLETKEGQNLAETKELIERVKENLKPHWKSMNN